MLPLLSLCFSLSNPRALSFREKNEISDFPTILTNISCFDRDHMRPMIISLTNVPSQYLLVEGIALVGSDDCGIGQRRLHFRFQGR